jgi:hypothetical protein
MVLVGVARVAEARVVALIWVGTSDTYGNVSTETLTLRVRLATACDTCWLSSSEMSKVGTGSGYRSWKGTVSGLEPSTKYIYRIFATGYSGERGGSSFTTEPDGPAKFKVGVASCMNSVQTPSQPSFAIMHEQLNTGEPNFHLLIGDNMYTTQNPPTKDHYWFKYMQQRQVPEFPVRLAEEWTADLQGDLQGEREWLHAGQQMLGKPAATTLRFHLRQQDRRSVLRDR